MKKYHWCRLYAEAVDDDKLRLLAFEDRWHFVAILCCKTQGILDQHPETLDRRVAVKLGLQVRDADEVRRRLVEVGLINENWQPVNWEKRQPSSDEDPTNAARQQRHRDKKRAEKPEKSENTKTCHTVTQSNGVTVTEVTDLELELELELEKEKEVVVVGDCLARAREREISRATEKQAAPAPTATLRSVEEVADIYHSILIGRPKCDTGLAIDTRRNIDFLLKAKKPGRDPNKWRRFFEYVAESDFLMGRKKGTFGRECFEASLFWLAKPENFAQVLSGKYHDGRAHHA